MSLRTPKNYKYQNKVNIHTQKLKPVKKKQYDTFSLAA